MYLSDTMHEFCKSRDEMLLTQLKAKKISQLAQKLYQLTILEETLHIKKRMLSGGTRTIDVAQARPPMIYN